MPDGAPARSWRRVGRELLARATGAAPFPATGAVQMRSRANSDTALAIFVLASVPAALVWAWASGRHALGATALQDGWRLRLLELAGLPATPEHGLACLMLGLSYVLPLFLAATTVAVGWAAVFAKVRGRFIDPGWLMSAWFFVLLVPADLPLALAAAGMSFAAVIGQHIFGGTGRYVVSPAALGALFVQFSYPGAGALSPGGRWAEIVAGAPPGVADYVPALACLAGALLLVRAGLVSARTLAGGTLGILLAGIIAGTDDLPGTALHLQLVTGSVPVCLAFVLTDPTTLPLTRVARWLHGFIFGILVIAVRVLDPGHPDGALFALLLATLLVPLLDHYVVRSTMRRQRGLPGVRA